MPVLTGNQFKVTDPSYQSCVTYPIYRLCVNDPSIRSDVTDRGNRSRTHASPRVRDPRIKQPTPFEHFSRSSKRCNEFRVSDPADDLYSYQEGIVCDTCQLLSDQLPKLTQMMGRLAKSISFIRLLL